MKRISIFKRLLILVLVFMLSINSFAAIVADNDGATFITKAEFDSLKNIFQAQIDNYNMSIDSKIEGAIASYLSGIKIQTNYVMDDYIKKLNTNSNLPYKYWTDILKIGSGTHAKYGLFGGFWSVNYAANTNKTGSFWGRMSAVGNASDMAFAWTSKTSYVREKLYMCGTFQGNNYLIKPKQKGDFLLFLVFIELLFEFREPLITPLFSV